MSIFGQEDFGDCQRDIIECFHYNEVINHLFLFLLVKTLEFIAKQGASIDGLFHLLIWQAEDEKTLFKIFLLFTNLRCFKHSHRTDALHNIFVNCHHRFSFPLWVAWQQWIKWEWGQKECTWLTLWWSIMEVKEAFSLKILIDFWNKPCSGPNDINCCLVLNSM